MDALQQVNRRFRLPIIGSTVTSTPTRTPTTLQALTQTPATATAGTATGTAAAGGHFGHNTFGGESRAQQRPENGYAAITLSELLSTGSTYGLSGGALDLDLNMNVNMNMNMALEVEADGNVTVATIAVSALNATSTAFSAAAAAAAAAATTTTTATTATASASASASAWSAMTTDTAGYGNNASLNGSSGGGGGGWTNATLAFDESNEMLKTIEMIGTILSFYYVPIIVCSGCIGNILSVFVFFKTKLRKLSSSFYLAALAVSDTCFLIGLFAQWLNFVDVHFYNRDYFCQFFTYFSNLACFCSVWFVVAFTVERFIAVMYPLKRQTMCTVRRAKIVLLGLTLLGCLHCVPFWISSTPVYSPKLDTTICDIKSEYKEYITLLNYWDTLVVYAVPFTTIAVLNTFTGCTVWKFASVRRSLTMQKRRTQLNRDPLASCSSTTSGGGGGGGTNAISTSTSTSTSTTNYRIASLKRQKSSCSHPSGHNNVSRKSTKRKLTNSSQLKVTKMLLIVSTVFVCLNLPSCVMRMKTFLETQTATNEKTTVVLQYIFQLLFITNFGINFVLYCVSGQNFRKAVLSMFRRVSSAQRDGTTQVTVSEYCRNSGVTGTSTRRRMMTHHCWNEIHELHPLK